MIDCTDEQLIEEVRRRGFVIRDAQVGKKWVGLTEDEFESILEQHNEAFPFAVYLSIEQQLKEKNT